MKRTFAVVAFVFFIVVACARASQVGEASGPATTLALRFPDHLVIESLASDGRRSGSSRISLPPGVISISLSHGGRALAVTTAHDIYVEHLGGTLRRVVHDSGPYPSFGLAWSPRADELLVTHEISCACDAPAPHRTTSRQYLRGTTLLVTPDGATSTIATFVADVDLTTWSGDGRSVKRLIAYALPPYAAWERSRDEVRAVPVRGGRADLDNAQTLGLSAAGGQLFPTGDRVLARDAVVVSGGSARGASIAADGQDVFLLASGEPSRWLGFSISGGIASHDGSKVALVAGRYRMAWAEKRLRICSIRPVACVTADQPAGTVAQQPAWSPTDDRLAFVRANDLGTATWGFSGYDELDRRWLQTRALVIADARGSTLRVLDRGRIYWPRWTPDGSAVVYVRDGAAWLARADGTTPAVRVGTVPRITDYFGSYGNLSESADSFTISTR